MARSIYNILFSYSIASFIISFILWFFSFRYKKLVSIELSTNKGEQQLINLLIILAILFFVIFFYY